MPTGRKIDAMHLLFGVMDGLCKDCDHMISGRYHDMILHKCEMYGLTHSEASDWRLSYKACGLYNTVPYDYDKWVPILERLKRGMKPTSLIDGQERMEV